MASLNKSLLTQDEISARLGTVPGWHQEEGRLVREFEFKNFQQAFGFMGSVACVAERLFHHPEWSNVYNKVTIAITNHSAGGLTDLDFEFAEMVNELYR